MTRTGPIVAVYPGSFDPITRGHEDIARRTLRFADRLVVAVARTATHAKAGLFPVEERVTMIREVFAGEDRVEVTSFQGLLVRFARELEANFVIRGLRAVSDFE
ncbi:MAG TPA: adenylyltransferase/cytidyltransferase family protein, partial [Longimicrobiales bacterium]|nr:adenylyltransferase/cytidyltransferase family protein [Longimicrobiales bacterium]